MIFSWLRNRRRRRLLATPFPEAWHGWLERNVAHYGWLDDEERRRLRERLRVFVAETSWEGCGGLNVSEEMQVTIAAQASLLVLGLDPDLIRHVTTVLVYPGGFLVPQNRVDAGVLVTEYQDARIGEAHQMGLVVLSWDEVLRSGRDPGEGENLVYHEFAHQLDFLDGVVDGTPPLETPADYTRWREVMTRAFQRLTRESAAGFDTLLDGYGATDPGEFFAVVTETFFDRPRDLLDEDPELYRLLRGYYRQDPARRGRRRPGPEER